MDIMGRSQSTQKNCTRIEK